VVNKNALIYKERHLFCTQARDRYEALL